MRICVFCGSRTGTETAYRQAAARLGGLLAARGIGLVFGGGSVGLMGILADAALAGGGEVIGVIPRALATTELLHPRVADMRVVGSMHERKALMAELGGAFVALPGGLGTLEEIFEALTWAQLGLHDRPCGFLNAGGYYDRLLEFLDHATARGFLKRAHRALAVVEEDPEALVETLLRTGVGSGRRCP